MTRAEFVQRQVLGNANAAGQRVRVHSTRIRLANELADALEKSKTAPWDTQGGTLKVLHRASEELDAAVKVEREACAKLCEEWSTSLESQRLRLDLAYAIRQRKSM